jgi:LacI family transcriptional regulator
MLPKVLSHCAQVRTHVVPAPLALREEFPMRLGQRLDEENVKGAVWMASDRRAISWIARQAREADKPLVRLMKCQGDARWGCVDTDHEAVGREGAHHLLEQGFTEFCFVALDVPWCLQRMNGFAAALHEAEHECHTMIFDPGEQTGGVHDRLVEFVETLPKPVAIMAGIDRTAEIISSACRELDLVVPAEVAILGSDNEVSQYSQAAISTVECDYKGIADTALQMLDDMAEGRCPGGKVKLVAPTGVVQRASTERLVEADQLVARALRYLQSRPPDELNLEDLYAHLSVSARTVRRHFRKAMGFSPQHEIQRLRLRAVKRMLRTTDLPLVDISVRSGYDYMSNMCHAFKGLFGMTPTEYRRMYHSNRTAVRESG